MTATPYPPSLPPVAVAAPADNAARPQALAPVLPAGREFFGHPVGLYICFLTEMWERFSFYGMKGLLFLYLTKYHLFTDRHGYALLGAYGGLVYAAPVFGGWLADRYLGARKAVTLGAVLLVIGHGLMAFEGHKASVVNGAVVRDATALSVFYAALGFIIVGVGFLKSNISGIVGRLYADGDPRRDSGFTIFYAGINLGALLAALVCGYLGETYGWRYGFGAAGIGMALGLAVFLGGQKHFLGRAEPPDVARLKARTRLGLSVGQLVPLGALLGVAVVWLLIQVPERAESAMYAVGAAFAGWFVWYLFARCTQPERRHLVGLALVIGWCLAFYMLYEQTYGAWVAFTDRHLEKSLLGVGITTAQTTGWGALFIVLLAPVFAALWPWLARRGWNPPIGIKAALGLALGGLAFLPLYVAAQAAGGGSGSGAGLGLVSMGWLVFAYLLLEAGEVALAPIGLSAVSRLAPARILSVMMGGWFLATAFSELFAAKLSSLAALDAEPGKGLDVAASAASFGHLFGLMAATGLGLAVVALLTTPWLSRMAGRAEDDRAAPPA